MLPELTGCCSIPQHSFILENVILQCLIYCYVSSNFLFQKYERDITSEYRSSLYKEDHNLMES